MLKKHFRLVEGSFDFRFVWIPAHKGIKLNDIADKAAKNATNWNRPIKPDRISVSDVLREGKEELHQLWQEE